MGQDIQRLRNDLEVMQEAVGGRLPFATKDVRLNLLLAGAGVAMIVLAAVLPVRMIRWSFAPVFLAAIPTVAAMRRKPAADSLEAARRREYRLAWLTAGVFVIAVVSYLLWQRQMGAPAEKTAGSACVIFAGVMCAIIAITNPARRYYLGNVVPLIVWGILMQHHSLRPLVVGGGIVGVCAALSVAAIQMWQLRGQERA